MTYTRTNDRGDTEYSDGEYWFGQCDVCHHCREDREKAVQPYRWAEVRTCMGIYAGRYCGECWKHSGYRDNDARFDPADAGETLEPEDY